MTTVAEVETIRSRTAEQWSIVRIPPWNAEKVHWLTRGG